MQDTKQDYPWSPTCFRQLLLVALVLWSGAYVQADAGDTYPYQQKAFDLFVADSFREQKSVPASKVFYQYLDRRLQTAKVRAVCRTSSDTAWSRTTWAGIADHERRSLQQIDDPAQLARQQKAFATMLHTAIKAAIPRFSLDRGFEFANVVRYGERQCLLQSVLIAGLLQRAGISAGVAMVWKNEQGSTSNNGHAVVLARFADGTDALVDASEMHPFARHQGLYLLSTTKEGYLYVRPEYTADRPEITGYLRQKDDSPLTRKMVKPVPAGFLWSQFSHYRGERAPGGILSPQPTAGGLDTAAFQLNRSIRQCPQNPLPYYFLGKIYLRQKKFAAATQQIVTAGRLYERAGWVPDNEREALLLVQKAPPVVSAVAPSRTDSPTLKTP